MQSREIRSYSDTSGIAPAMWAVLEDVYRHPRLEFGSFRTGASVDSNFASRDDWHFGIEVSSRASQSMSSLRRQSSPDAMLWFGYQRNLANKTHQAVWLYCESRDVAADVARRLNNLKHEDDKISRHADDYGNLVYIEIRRGESIGRPTSDFDWFAEQLFAIGALANRRRSR